MQLSALEIKQQAFAKTFRGYDTAEVQSFLNVVSNEWEHLSNKCKDQEREIQRLSEKLQHYHKVEEALHETLQTAKESAEQRILSSKQDAQNRIAKADLEAEKIVRDAQQERQFIRQNIQRLLERRHEIIRGIESYLDLASESLESFRRDDSSTYAMPEEAHQEKSGTKTRLPFEGQQNKNKSVSPVPSAEDIDDLLDDLDD